MNTFVSLSKGNPGALHFLMELSTAVDIAPNQQISTLSKIERMGIQGTDLYVLYSDLCGKDLNKVVHLVENCPTEILKDACSRQDYSGRALVAEYLN